MESELEEYDEIIENYISFATILNEGGGFLCLHLLLRLRGGGGFADLDMALASMSVMDLLDDDHDQEYTEEQENRGFQLLDAAWNGDKLRATQLLASKPTLMFYRVDGNTVLHAAAMLGNRSFVKKLIDFINVHKSKVFLLKSPRLVVNDDEDTALHLALKFKHKEVASDLMKEMPDPKIVCTKNKYYEMPIILSIRAGYMDLVEDMLKPAPWSSFCHRTRQILLHSPIVRDAIEINGLGMLQIVLDNMPALAESTFEWTPLTYAVNRGYVDKVRYLFKKFPDSATKCDRFGKFPIHEAIAVGNQDIVEEILVQYSEAMNQVYDGRRPLSMAASEGLLSLVRLLITNFPEYGPNVTRMDLIPYTKLLVKVLTLLRCLCHVFLKHCIKLMGKVKAYFTLLLSMQSQKSYLI